MADKFWIRLWMESGRGHSIIKETYELLEYPYDIHNTESLDQYAFDWAFSNMNGRDLMRFTSGFEIVVKPPKEWLKKEIIRLNNIIEKSQDMLNFVSTELYGTE